MGRSPLVLLLIWSWTHNVFEIIIDVWTNLLIKVLLPLVIQKGGWNWCWANMGKGVNVPAENEGGLLICQPLFVEDSSRVVM
jgi:hypothetical protein